MFGKMKLYKIVYNKIATYTVIIEARNEYTAIRKFRKEMGNSLYSIISFEETTVGRG